ncbi:site-specific recombinase XerD [Pedobacter glucosidilyticus]|nr:site-specific recombinase XerD [Pedobacter glucosidilyticus]
MSNFIFLHFFLKQPKTSFSDLLPIHLRITAKGKRTEIYLGRKCIARYTFATTVTLLNDVPIETVSKMLGHSSIKMTQHYAKILDIKVVKDVTNLKRK